MFFSQVVLLTRVLLKVIKLRTSAVTHDQELPFLVSYSQIGPGFYRIKVAPLARSDASISSSASCIRG